MVNRAQRHEQPLRFTRPDLPDVTVTMQYAENVRT
jgi:hypothetical protein